jgi:hypothetical protein
LQVADNGGVTFLRREPVREVAHSRVQSSRFT